MTKTKIEWATDVWNPVTGCRKVSEGCRNCYAERLANRFWGGRPFTDVQMHKDRLGDPLRWKKVRRVFVNSMSDLFHPDVLNYFINQVFVTMKLASKHTFLILTKRPDRMHDYLTQYTNGGWDRWEIIRHDAIEKHGEDSTTANTVWPLPNVWLGVSVETQKEADQRIPLLLETPAAVRFISVEPMLGDINLMPYLLPYGYNWDYERRGPARVNWVICGGESGPGARPMYPGWARSLRDQCVEAKVPFFFKQWGEWAQGMGPGSDDVYLTEDGLATHYPNEIPSGISFVNLSRVGKKTAGRLLDGQEWLEVPAT